VWTRIAMQGLKLLLAMDPAVETAPKEFLGHMDKTDVAELIRLLELARRNSEDLVGLSKG